MTGERIAVLGGLEYTNHSAVRRFIKLLAADTVVLLDDDPFDVHVAALRECRCSSLVAVVHRLPSNAGKKAVEARRQRDLVLLESASRAVVFGRLSPDRESTLSELEGRGLSVERRPDEERAAAATTEG